MWKLIFHFLLQAIVTCSALSNVTTSQNFDAVKVSNIQWLPDANMTVQTSLECAALCHLSIHSFCCNSFLTNMTNDGFKLCWLSRQTFEDSNPLVGDGIKDFTIFVRRELDQDCEKIEQPGNHQECVL